MLQNLIDIVTELKGNSKGEKKKKEKESVKFRWDNLAQIKITVNISGATDTWLAPNHSSGLVSVLCLAD